jgi:hypothetical protein
MVMNRIDQPNGHLSNYVQETLKLVELVDVCPFDDAVTVAVAVPPHLVSGVQFKVYTPAESA